MIERSTLSIVTGPTAEPVVAADARAQSHISQTADDTLLSGYITAARRYAETRLRRQLMPATYLLTLDRFPMARGADWGFGNTNFAAWDYRLPAPTYLDAQTIVLPRSPVQSLTSIVYLDDQGVSRTLDPSQYILDRYAEPARVTPAYGLSWPSNQVQPNAIQITFVAGYADAASVPQTIKLGILQLVAHWYEHREAIHDSPLAKVPMSVEMLFASEQVLSYP